MANQFGSSSSSSLDNSGSSHSSSSDNSRLLGSSNSYNSSAQIAKLYQDVKSGNWNDVNQTVRKYEGLKKTALRAAVQFGQLEIVRKLVKSMKDEEIKHTDNDGFTALASAAQTGFTDIAECIIRKNNSLAEIPNNFDQLPVTLAVLSGNKKMAHYLYSVTPLKTLLSDNGRPGAILLNQLFLSNNLDLALHLLQQHPRLAITPDEQGATLVWALAGKPSVFNSGCKLQFWQRWIYDRIQIDFVSAIKHIPNNVAKSNATESEPGTHMEHESASDHTWINITESNTTQSELGTQIELQPTTNHILVNITESNALQSESGTQIELESSTIHIPTNVMESNEIQSESGIRRIYKSKLTHVLSAELLRLTCDQISILSNTVQLSEAQVYDSLFRAAKCGIPEFIIEVIRTKPNLLTVTDKDDDRNLFFKAVQFRQAKVFNLIYGFHSKNAAACAVDENHNTLLHMAAKLAPSTQLNQISGAALQMQRELQWFKEVEHVVPSVMRERLNSDGKTARELFTDCHKDLVEEGERWMKKTAKSCTVVAALTLIIMFAASITVSGGNNQNIVYPILQDHKYFKVFIIADATSLLSSTTSLLIFLGILTSRYAENDFLKSLPTKLIICLSMLFISMAAMMISFFATISAMLPERLWIIIPMISFAIILVTLFFRLLFPLLCEIYISTYRSCIFERNTEPWF